jgi:hypothetical protein
LLKQFLRSTGSTSLKKVFNFRLGRFEARKELTKLSRASKVENSAQVLTSCTEHFLWRHDTQYNDIQHNDTYHKDIQHNDTHHKDIQHNDTHHKDIQHNNK